MASAKLDLGSVIDSAHLTRFHWMVIGACAVVTMLDGFDTQSIAFVAPNIALAWHLDPAKLGPVFGAGLFGGLLGAVFFGPLADRIGRKPVLLISVSVFGIGSLITPLFDSVPYLISARFVTGIGLGGAFPSAVALASEFAPRRLRSTLVSAMFCGFPLGAVIGGLASAKLIPHFGWRSVFLIGGVLPALLAPLLLAVLPESVKFLAHRGARDKVARILGRLHCIGRWDGELFGSQNSAVNAPFAKLFSDGRATGTYLLWLTFFLSLLTTYLLISWIPVLARGRGLGMQSAVVAVAMLNLGSIVGSILIGRLADHRDRAMFIGLGYVFGAFSIALLGILKGSEFEFCFVTFLAGACSLGAQICTVALCSAFYDTDSRSTGVGWSIAIGRIGAVVGPIIAGLMIGAGAPSGALFFLASAASFGAATAVFAFGKLVPDGQALTADRFTPSDQRSSFEVRSQK